MLRHLQMLLTGMKVWILKSVVFFCIFPVVALKSKMTIHTKNTTTAMAPGSFRQLAFHLVENGKASDGRKFPEDIYHHFYGLYHCKSPWKTTICENICQFFQISEANPSILIFCWVQVRELFTLPRPIPSSNKNSEKKDPNRIQNPKTIYCWGFFTCSLGCSGILVAVLIWWLGCCCCRVSEP